GTSHSSLTRTWPASREARDGDDIQRDSIDTLLRFPTLACAHAECWERRGDRRQSTSAAPRWPPKLAGIAAPSDRESRRLCDASGGSSALREGARRHPSTRPTLPTA